jgi:hypothetical protein
MLRSNRGLVLITMSVQRQASRSATSLTTISLISNAWGSVGPGTWGALLTRGLSIQMSQ